MRDPLERALKAAGIRDVDVTGRPKHLWSIFKKMQKRDKPYDEIYDLLAIRVLVNSVPDCYHALRVIHDGWTPLQERIKVAERTLVVETIGQMVREGWSVRVRTVRIGR